MGTEAPSVLWTKDRLRDVPDGSAVEASGGQSRETLAQRLLVTEAQAHCAKGRQNAAMLEVSNVCHRVTGRILVEMNPTGNQLTL